MPGTNCVLTILLWIVSHHKKWRRNILQIIVTTIKYAYLSLDNWTNSLDIFVSSKTSNFLIGFAYNTVLLSRNSNAKKLSINYTDVHKAKDKAICSTPPPPHGWPNSTVVIVNGLEELTNVCGKLQSNNRCV